MLRRLKHVMVIFVALSVHLLWYITWREWLLCLIFEFLYIFIYFVIIQILNTRLLTFLQCCLLLSWAHSWLHKFAINGVASNVMFAFICNQIMSWFIVCECYKAKTSLSFGSTTSYYKNLICLSEHMSELL